MPSRYADRIHSDFDLSRDKDGDAPHGHQVAHPCCVLLVIHDVRAAEHAARTLQMSKGRLIE
jgi:hypothetical protein